MISAAESLTCSHIRSRIYADDLSGQLMAQARDEGAERSVGFDRPFGGNITLTSGPAPVRAYVAELLPDILSGTIEPGKVFDATTDLDGIPAGYKDTNNRKSLKVLIEP